MDSISIVSTVCTSICRCVHKALTFMSLLQGDNNVYTQDFLMFYTGIFSTPVVTYLNNTNSLNNK